MGPEDRVERSGLRRGLRGAALLALLLGPLVAAEIWVRGQLDLLYPYITDRSYWPETKLLLLRRAGCPEVLTLGTSLTNKSLDPGLASEVVSDPAKRTTSPAHVPDGRTNPKHIRRHRRRHRDRDRVT